MVPSLSTPRLRYLRPMLLVILCLFLTAEPNISQVITFGVGVNAAPQAQLGSEPVTIITVDTSEDLESGSLTHTCDYTFGAATFFPAPDGKCTFRRAIREAAARPQADRPIEIRFNLPQDDPNRDQTLDVFIIPIDEQLPELKTDDIGNLNGQVLIDGSTQPLTRPADQGPGVIIQTNDNSLIIPSEKNIIRGLSFRGGGAIFLRGDGNVVENIWMGLGDDGQSISFRTPGSENRMAGGGIFVTSNDNLIQNNTISGAFAKAIEIGSNISGNVVQQNNIGTLADGTVPLIDPNVQCTGAFSYLPDQYYGGWGIAISGSNNTVLKNRIAGLHNIRSGNETAPMAIEIFGNNHTIRENIIGRDSEDKDVGVCGQGIKVSDQGTQIVGNTIVRSRTGFESTQGEALDAAILASDSAASPFGEITIRGNIIVDGPGRIYAFGPLLPEVLKTFEPAKITSISGTSVVGTSGDGSPCPECLVDFYLDDIDPTEEALVYLGETVADENGDFTYELSQPLSPGQTIRTASTTQDENLIGTYDAGTTTKFSIPYGPDGLPVTPIAPTATPTADTSTVEPVNTPTPTNTPTPSPEPTPTTQPVTIITVNTTLDPDPTDRKLTCGYERGAFFFPGDPQGGTCSFRYAWNEAVGRPQEDRPIEIRFDIPTTDPNYELTVPGTWVLQTDAVLLGLNPDNGANGLSDNGSIIIDGNSQPGGRTDGPKIIFDTKDFSWEIESENNLITNISMRGGGVIFLKESSNVVENIWMGLTDDGNEIAFRTPGDLKRMAGGGVFISSDNNVVRGNVISGAFAKAVDINSGNVNNLIVDNYIGTRADGTVPQLDPAAECVPGFDLLDGSWKGGWGISLAGTGNKVINNVIAGLDNLRSTNDTPPMAIELFGADHIIEGNVIGRDTAGYDVGVCGQGIKFSDTGHQIIRNTIVRSRQGFENNILTSILASDSAIGAFGQVTIRENIVIDSPERIFDFGPGISDELRFFNPGKITGIDGTTVRGTNGTDSPCPGCLIDIYLDDYDELQESYTFLGSTLADSNGNFIYEMASPLNPGEALRTASTTQSSNVIPGFGPGTTTEFSTLSVPIETINIDGPTSGEPGVTYRYTVTVGPSYAGRPISMTVDIEGVAPSFLEYGENEEPVYVFDIKWNEDGIKTIAVTAENDMARLTEAMDMDLGGEEVTPTSTPEPSETSIPSETSTPEPSETSVPSETSTSEPSETSTSEPSETSTSEPSETGTPEPSETSQPSGTPTPQPTDLPLSDPGGTSTDGIYLPVVQG